MTPQPLSKLLSKIAFSTSGGVFLRLIWVLSLIAGKCQSIPARRIDPVEEGPALLEAADVVEDDRGGGRGVGEGGDVRGHEDPRVVPERVIGGQRLVAEDVEHRARDVPGSK